MRAVVPFRNRREVGVILGPSDTLPSGIKAKPVVALPDLEPVLEEPMLALCRWMSDYYVVPLGLTIRSVLPASLSSHEAPEPSRRTRRVASIVRELPSLLERDTLFARARQQRALFELLESLGGHAAVEHLTERLKFSPSVLRALATRGLVAIEDEVVARDPFARRATKEPARHVPSAAQQAALDRLR